MASLHKMHPHTHLSLPVPTRLPVPSHSSSAIHSELSHHISVMAKMPRICDYAQSSSSYCWFPKLSLLLYRCLQKALSCPPFSGREQELSRLPCHVYISPLLSISVNHSLHPLMNLIRTVLARLASLLARMLWPLFVRWIPYLPSNHHICKRVLWLKPCLQHQQRSQALNCGIHPLYPNLCSSLAGLRTPARTSCNPT